MAISSYPNGFAEGVLIRGVPLLQAYPGKVFWVGNSAAPLQGEAGASDSNKGTFLSPFSTIDAAIGMCADNRGDIIVVRPNHVSTVIVSNGILLDIAGVSIVGLGSGSSRPTINFTTATSSRLTVSAANCSIANFLFTGGIDGLTNPITISAADFSLIGCEYRDVVGETVDAVVTTSPASRLMIKDHVHAGAAGAGANSGIAINGGSGIVIDGLRMDGNFAVGGIDIRTNATTNLEVRNVWFFRTRNAADIFIVDTITGSTGCIGPNISIRLQDNAANITEACTGATFVYMQPINIVNLAGESSILTNITASTDA